MLKPTHQTEPAFLDEFQQLRTDSDAVHLWRLGQGGVLIAHGGTALVVDPYLSDSLTEKYAETDKPHIRITARLVAPEKLAPIDVLLSTHNHTDHCDAATINPIIDENPEIALLVPRANIVQVGERLALPPEHLTPMSDGDVIRFFGRDKSEVAVHAVAAAHEERERNEYDDDLYLGYIIEIGGRKIYCAGDTVAFPALVQAVTTFAPDVAFLPINGRGAGVAGNMSEQEAAQFAKETGIRCVVPCHYDMFEFNVGDTQEFAEECQKLGVNYRVLDVGEVMTLAST